jgi:hypothetical protein
MKIVVEKIYIDSNGHFWRVDGTTNSIGPWYKPHQIYHLKRIFHRDGDNYARCDSDGIFINKPCKIAKELIEENS